MDSTIDPSSLNPDQQDFLESLRNRARDENLAPPIERSSSPTARITGLEFTLFQAETQEQGPIREWVASAKRILDINSDGGVLLSLAQKLGNNPKRSIAISKKPYQFGYCRKPHYNEYLESDPHDDSSWEAVSGLLENERSKSFDLIFLTIKCREDLALLTPDNLARAQGMLSKKGKIVILYAIGEYPTKQLNGLSPVPVDDKIYKGVRVIEKVRLGK